MHERAQLPQRYCHTLLADHAEIRGAAAEAGIPRRAAAGDLENELGADRLLELLALPDRITNEPGPPMTQSS